MQAAVSHNHPDAVAAAQAVELSIFLLRQSHRPAAVRGRLIKEFGYDLTPQRALGPGGFDESAAGTVPPALTAAFTSQGWEEAVRAMVSLGGDTDTLACITGAVAEAIHAVTARIAAIGRNYLTDGLQPILNHFEQQRRSTA